MHQSDPKTWELEDLEPIPRSERKHYVEAVRLVPLGLNLLAVDSSGRQLVGSVGEEFALGGAMIHVDLDDMAARFISTDVESFLVAAREIQQPRVCWHWLNELVAECPRSWQPSYASIEIAVGLSRGKGVASALLISMRRQISRGFMKACLGAPFPELAERALEEAIRRRTPGLHGLVERFIKDPRPNVASAARRYLREAAVDNVIEAK